MSYGLSDYINTLSSDEQRSSQDAINQGASLADVEAWWRAKKGGAVSQAGGLTPEQQAQVEAQVQAGVGQEGYDPNAVDRNEIARGLGFGQDAQKANMGSLLTMYGGQGAKQGFTSNEVTGRDNFQQLLASAKAFDPNAHLSENGELIFDRSKMPQSKMGDMSKYGAKGGNFNDYFSRLEGGHGVGGGDINDASKVIHDPVYGDYIQKNYMGEGSGDSSKGFMGQTEKYMPAIVSAIMAAGMGAAAGPMLGGALSATMGPGGIANKAAMGEDIDWKKAGINAAMSIGGGYLANVASGMMPADITKMLSTIKPWIDRGMQAMKAYQLYKQMTQG